jgi:hypothetical protein
VEVLQVERVLDRMNTFLRLMHVGLSVPALDQRRIDVQKELIAARKKAPTFLTPLKSAFPLPEWAMTGPKARLEVEASVAIEIQKRFARLRGAVLDGMPVTWSDNPPKGSLLGSVLLESGRGQPFTLLLRVDHGRPVVRCVSPIGRTEPESDTQAIVELAARTQSRVGAILTREVRSYDLTVEDDVLLGASEHDAVRVGLLVRRVAQQADQMEREHFEDGRDAPLEAFDADLRDEGGDDD